MLLCGTAAVFAQNPWEKDLLAYWSFDEGAGYSVGDYTKQFSGRKNGKTTWLTPELAKFGSAMRFDDTDSADEGFVSLPSGGALESPNASSMSICVWVRSNLVLSQMPARSFASIFNSSFPNHMDKDQNNYILFYDQQSACLRARFTTAQKFVRPSVAAGDIPVGKWYHIAAVYDGSQAAIYLNGEKKDSKPLSGLLRNGQVSAIGRKGTSDMQYWRGDIDDLAIWTRALSASEVSTLAAGDAPLSQLLGLAAAEKPSIQVKTAEEPVKPSNIASAAQPAGQKPTLYYFFLPDHQGSRTFYDSVIRNPANYQVFRQFKVVPVNMDKSKDELGKYAIVKSPTIVVIGIDGEMTKKFSGAPEEGELLTELKKLVE